MVNMLFSCKPISPETLCGFWEGPHPEDNERKFYVHFFLDEGKMAARGYWTENNFYRSSFDVDSLRYKGREIQFFIPLWNCTYLGRIEGAAGIKGGFHCKGDPFDPVELSRNNGISIYLLEAYPGCLSPDFRYDYVSPTNLSDGIPASGYEVPGDSLFIHSLLPEIIAGEYGRINSFLLLRGGKLVCEEYFFGYSRYDLHPIESCTKSITSLLVGLARDMNMITGLDEPISIIFPEYAKDRSIGFRSINLEHLLTMTAGFQPVNDELLQSSGRIGRILQREPEYPPGDRFIYDGGSTEILGAVIREKTGLYADRFAEDYLFPALGIDTFNWEVLKDEGYPCMAGSLKLLPRDLARIGHLVLDKGRFGGRQVISEQWIEESTKNRITTHIEGDHYGYHWWNIDLGSGDRKYETVWANGWGSQFIYIIPELDVVIVTTGSNYEFDSWSISAGISRYLHLLE
jgi:CubicO group peptidase (beta-lactamase class C family)